MKVSMNHFRLCTTIAVMMLCVARANGADSTYDPLTLPIDAKLEILDLTIRGESGGRDIPVLVYLPAERTPSPVVLF